LFVKSDKIGTKTGVYSSSSPTLEAKKFIWPSLRSVGTRRLGAPCQSQICVLSLIWYQIKFHRIRSPESTDEVKIFVSITALKTNR
ncbi:MAG: hypothetical protein NUV76_06430, partial [Candidatus Kuenenia sp.]|nr:hypothetical protein [Candidatus Kuenenia sp.]